jgi:hypothetical protein
MAHYPTNPADVVVFIGKIADLLRKEGVRVVGLKEFFDASDTDAAADALGGYVEGFVAGAVRGAAIEAIALACMRASDRAGPDRWTIPTVKLLLTDQAHFNAVVAAGGDRETLGHFLRLAEEIETDHSFARLRKYRDYYIAHHLRDKFAKLDQTDQADLRDLWYVVDDVLRTIYHLMAGTGRATVTFDSDAVVWRERNEAYWRRLIEGPRGRKVKGGGPCSPSG